MSARVSSSSSSTQYSSPPPDIQKDGDSDFAELSTLDDVDVSDQLVRKKEVRAIPFKNADGGRDEKIYYIPPL